MNTNTFKYALLVFFGGASYGFMAPIAKLAGANGFTWQEIACSQAVFGVLVFGVAAAISAAFKGRAAIFKPVSPLQAAKLIGTGMMTCSTCVLYNYALSLLPVAAAITLLFQFTWIGVVIQVIVTRRAPHPIEVIAAALVIFGTVLASGLYGVTSASLDPLGVLCGLGSSVTCALFMYLSSRIEVDMPCMQRGLIVCCGASLLGLIVCPHYFSSGILVEGMAGYGLVLGLTALFIPVLFFGIGTPHLPTGVSTILAASELPAAIALTFIATGVGVTLIQFVGIAIILIGVAATQAPNLLLTPNEESSD